MSEFAGHETQLNAMTSAELTVPDHHHHHHNGVVAGAGAAGDVAAMIENFQNKKSSSAGGGTAAMLNRINANNHGPGGVLSTTDGVNVPASAQVVSSSTSSSRVKRSSQVGNYYVEIMLPLPSLSVRGDSPPPLGNGKARLFLLT